MVTIEELKEEIKNLKAQRENALAVAQQATGAIMLAELLISKLETEKEQEA